MKKNYLRIIATIMLFIGLVFIWYALNHPEASFPWGNEISFFIYGAYFGIMLTFFIISSKK